MGKGGGAQPPHPRRSAAPHIPGERSALTRERGFHTRNGLGNPFPGAVFIPGNPAARLRHVVLAFEILLVLVSVLIAWFGLYVLYRLFTES
ncbi:hypothetical protein Ntsu_07310 [Nocardia sp. IFM 10818]